MKFANSKRFRPEELLLLLFGLFIAPLVFAYLIFDLVESQNRFVNQTRIEQARGALDLIDRTQRHGLHDYALWDEMFTATVVAPDREWYHENAGSRVGELHLGASTLVIDGDMRPVFGSWRGKDRIWDPQRTFPGQFAPLFEAAVQDDGMEGVTGFLPLGGGVVAVSISRIDANIRAVEENVLPARYLVFVEDLDNHALEHVRESLAWPDLSITGVRPGDKPSLPILSPAGATVGHMAWNQPALADRALKSRWQVIATAFLMTSLATIGLHWKLRRAVGRLCSAEHEARRLADSDPLTGVCNRRRFSSDGEALTAAGRPLQALVIDLDGFKRINDRLGHRAGDALLAEVGSRMQRCLPEAAVFARLGGDEFGVLVSLDDAAAVELGQDMAMAVAAPVRIGQQVVSVGASIGVADSEGCLNFDELMRRADVAMYSAKAERSGLTRLYRESLDQEHRLACAIDIEMRDGLERGEFWVAYQPILTARTGQVTAVEALLRWNHPTRGLVSPNLFIPIAERSRFVIELGDFVLRTACREVMESGLDVSVSVNLSAVQLLEPSIVERVCAILAETGLPPDRLELEVTETYLVEQERQASELLARLRAAGITTSLDDFGCGYASIGYLRSFPLDKVKIDRSYVAPIDTDADARAVLKAIVDLCRAFGKRITAEGVETPQQAEFLRQIGCDRLQGYLFARPGSLQEANGEKTGARSA